MKIYNNTLYKSRRCRRNCMIDVIVTVEQVISLYIYALHTYASMRVKKETGACFAGSQAPDTTSKTQRHASPENEVQVLYDNPTFGFLPSFHLRCGVREWCIERVICFPPYPSSRHFASLATRALSPTVPPTHLSRRIRKECFRWQLSLLSC